MSGETMSPGVSAASFSASAGGISKGGTAEFGGSKSSVGSMGSIENGPIGPSKSFGGGDQPGMFGKDSPIGNTQSFSEFSPIGKVSGESFEGSMKGVSPFQGTQVIGKASLDSPKAPETPKISAFSDTMPFTANLGIISEGPAPRSVFSETQAIYEAPKSVSELASPQETQTQKVFEAVLSEEPQALIAGQDVDIQTAETPIIGFESPNETVDEGVNATLETYFAKSEEFQAIATPENVDRFMSDLESEDPDAYAELARDMRAVGEVQRLIQAADIEPELAEQIEQSAVKTAANKARVIEIAQAMIEAQTEAEANPKSDETQRRAGPRTDSDQDGLTNDSNDNNRNTPPKTDEQLIREEPVDEARVTHMSKAIDQAYAPKEEGEVVRGTEITAYMSPIPSSDEQSGYAKMLGMSEDGTYTELVGEMGERTFDAGNIDQAKSEAKRLAEIHYAVTIGNSGRPAEEKQAVEVKRGGAAKAGTIFSS